MGLVRRSWQGGTLKFHLWALCFFVFTLIFPTAVSSGQSPESVTEAPAYSSARPCAQGCVYNDYYTIDLGEAMGCDANTYCFCRQDLRATGSVFISKCVNSRCSTNALDMSWAFLAWAQYCSFGDAPSTQPTGTSVVQIAAPSTTPAGANSTPIIITQTVTIPQASSTIANFIPSVTTAVLTVTKILVGATATSSSSGSISGPKQSLQVVWQVLVGGAFAALIGLVALIL